MYSSAGATYEKTKKSILVCRFIPVQHTKIQKILIWYVVQRQHYIRKFKIVYFSMQSSASTTYENSKQSILVCSPEPTLHTNMQKILIWYVVQRRCNIRNHKIFYFGMQSNSNATYENTKNSKLVCSPTPALHTKPQKITFLYVLHYFYTYQIIEK